MTCACGQPTNDGYLCHDCTHLLNVALFTAAWLGPQLDIARSRQAVLGERNGRAGTPRCSPKCGPNCGHTTVLPYDVRAAAAGDHLAMVLGGVLRALNLPAMEAS